MSDTQARMRRSGDGTEAGMGETDGPVVINVSDAIRTGIVPDGVRTSLPEFVPTNRGYITNEFTIWCGRCAIWDTQSGTRQGAIRHWTSHGWTATRRDGWVCPVCSKDDKP